MAQMHSDIAQRSAECENLKAVLQRTSEAHAALQSENASLKTESERLSASLQSEISMNEERKKKLREYVNNLTAEKKASEEKCAALEKSEQEALSKRAVLEQQLSVLEIKLGTTRDQGMLDLETKTKELVSLEAFYKSAVDEKEQENRR